MTLDFRNPNTLWGSIAVETLTRLGLTTAVLCPGSRSTPLTVAFARHPAIEAIPVLDERSAAFFALGLAKQLGKPIALLCTSGTATANFYPAVIEARESRVPLLILTADRPPENRHCHAGQTIDQLKLYGHYPNWQAEISLPSLQLDRLAYLRQTLLHAWERCLYPTAGPVHLNFPFRDPLPPLPDLATQELESHFDEAAFFGHISDYKVPVSPNPVEMPDFSEKGIIIAGVATPRDRESYCQAIAYLSTSLQYPVLAEALSPVRNHASINPHLVTTYDFLLRHQENRQELTPDMVIQIGELPTSKELRSWLETLDPPRWIIEASPDNFDALQGKTRHIRTTVERFAKILRPTPAQSSPYCQKWLELDRTTKERIEAIFSEEQQFIEGKLAWLLSRHLPPDTPVFITNSMPVRHAEFFWTANDRSLLPYFNRGANGIDGTLSTALGMAHKNRPSVLLTGDLALLHDTNGFLTKNYFQGSLTVIVINNNGGGIFEMLPIAKFEPPFQEFFATPQNIDFSRLCHTYGVEYHPIESWEDLVARLDRLPEEGIQMLEVKCDRSLNARWLQENLPRFARPTPKM
jgi:2-succinyl-5-enolpyruvyl-6-hydroxy-3-cyclohexene-1-carboxylate synthase